MSERFLTPDGIGVPAVTADEMRSVDRVAVEEFGLPLLSMMENAGRTLATHARELRTGPVTVVAGAGGNGGGGLAAARHLHNRGAEVEVVLDRPPEAFDGAAGRQLSVLQRAAVPIHVGTGGVDPATDTLVDALIGYGLDGDLRGTAADLVAEVDDADATVLSLDVPSGLDATTGEVLGETVAADRVLTLALPKTGLASVDAPLYLADIAIPPAVYRDLGIDYTVPFGDRYWVRLDVDSRSGR